MSHRQCHYYLLAGESLHALNRLIEYDRLGTSWKLEGLMAKVNVDLGQATKTAEKTDGADKISGFTDDFGAAQIKCYQKTLGFHDLPIQVRDYASGTIFRAYHVLPKFAMNPGTSTNYFGLADLFNKPEEQPAERTAIYLAYEDYTGNHFAPAGAKKLTDDEFHSYEGVEDDFDHYREYDQGTAMPADFDPEQHQTVNYLPKKGFPVSAATHNFILQDDVQKEIAAYDRGHQEWVMAYQTFRRELETSFRGVLTGGAEGRLSILVEDTCAPKEKLALELYMSREFLEKTQKEIEKYCDILRVDDQGRGQVHVVVRPRKNDDMEEWDAELVDAMLEKLEKTPVEPQRPALSGTLPGSSIDVKLTFDDKILGFPYMQIEKPHDEEVRILAFRMPANIHAIEAPTADCKKLTPDEYMALSGAEGYLNADNLPGHAFLLGGETLSLVRDFERGFNEYKTKDAEFMHRVETIIRAKAADCKIEEYRLLEYKTGNARELNFILSEKDFNQVKEDLLENFEEVYPTRAYEGMCRLTLKARNDTEKGRATQAVLEQVPYEPAYPAELAKSLGFDANGGYSLMCTENLQGTEQKAVLYIFPSYITGVDAPKGTYAMGKAEFMHFVADSYDVSGGTVPPPRPDQMNGVPSADGRSLNHARGILNGLKSSGFPLGHRSDSGWFRKPIR